MNFYGVKDILEKNCNEALNIYNYLLKNDEGYLPDNIIYILFI